MEVIVGVVTPHVAAGPEVELPAMTSGRLATVVSRTGELPEAPPHEELLPAHAELRASTKPAALERAAVAFRGRALERLSQRFDVPAVAGCEAATAALRTYGVGQVQLVHPPWFDDEFDELGVAYFRSQGFDAVVTKAVDLPNDPAHVEADGKLVYESPVMRGGSEPQRDRYRI